MKFWSAQWWICSNEPRPFRYQMADWCQEAVTRTDRTDALLLRDVLSVHLWLQANVAMELSKSFPAGSLVKNEQIAWLLYARMLWLSCSRKAAGMHVTQHHQTSSAAMTTPADCWTGARGLEDACLCISQASFGSTVLPSSFIALQAAKHPSIRILPFSLECKNLLATDCDVEQKGGTSIVCKVQRSKRGGKTSHAMLLMMAFRLLRDIIGGPAMLQQETSGKKPTAAKCFSPSNCHAWRPVRQHFKFKGRTGPTFLPHVNGTYLCLIMCFICRFMVTNSNTKK